MYFLPHTVIGSWQHFRVWVVFFHFFLLQQDYLAFFSLPVLINVPICPTCGQTDRWKDGQLMCGFLWYKCAFESPTPGAQASSNGFHVSWHRLRLNAGDVHIFSVHFLSPSWSILPRRLKPPLREIKCIFHILYLLQRAKLAAPVVAIARTLERWRNNRCRKHAG